MKVKKVAVTVAVCAALMGGQACFAEEQPFAVGGMGFAFDGAKVSSVQMSELSGLEMEETEGAWTPPGVVTLPVQGETDVFGGQFYLPVYLQDPASFGLSPGTPIYF